jgi:5'-methylthioadenosine phosphorylase
MGLIGVLSGNTIIQRSHLADKCKEQLLKNKYGEALASVNDKFALILRHGSDPEEYILPHLINHRANFQALKDLGVSEVVGINSTGSLKKELCPGMVVIPDDFITLTATPTTHQNKAVHIVPSLNEKVRQKLIAAAGRRKIQIADKGIYWQVTGPRLETKAEIKMMANFADIVGMTMANEAVIAVELDLPYASACSIDNFGNGIIDKPLCLEEIITGTRKNADSMIHLLEGYLDISSGKYQP